MAKRTALVALVGCLTLGAVVGLQAAGPAIIKMIHWVGNGGSDFSVSEKAAARATAEANPNHRPYRRKARYEDPSARYERQEQYEDETYRTVMGQ